MKIPYTLFLILLPFAGLMGQQSDLVLTFTGINVQAHAQLDSIWIKNLTRGCDTMLYWPDTVLGPPGSAIHDHPQGNDGFYIMLMGPNPVTGMTCIDIHTAFSDEVHLMLSDQYGRRLLECRQKLNPGIHRFDFKPGAGQLYILTAICRSCKQSVKIMNSRSGSGICSLTYHGHVSNKNSDQKTTADITIFELQAGDDLVVVGHHAAQESGLLETPGESSLYTFQFATNIPCVGAPEVVYEGRVYQTIQVCSQCWLKENLNVGTMIPGGQAMADNGIIEKYCYNNDTANCAIYGGLYQWQETVQYNDLEGTRGICPEGWHVPSHYELKILEGTADSELTIFNWLWDEDYPTWKGLDVGKNLKSTQGWSSNGNGTDKFGFTLLPPGMWDMFSTFRDLGKYTYIWSSSGIEGQAYVRLMHAEYDGITITIPYQEYGFTVRCLKDK